MVGPVVRISPNLYSFNTAADQKKIYNLRADLLKNAILQRCKTDNASPHRDSDRTFREVIHNALISSAHKMQLYIPTAKKF
ncbi:hypothetical protein HII31_04450 [Pseudocercospora fuligena]|uniref:Uncharacterized protein n=1 Tax=Pseudocercospora fuligena TaxID=685502 RepID=A0A8H6RNU2_9PEZI|nr:hypothetical protein HII31_04450 [Pseudocercospora fuligena]